MPLCSLIPIVFPKVLTCGLLLYSASVLWLKVSVIGSFIQGAVLVTLVPLILYAYFSVTAVGPGSPLDFDELRIRDVKDVEEGVEFPPEFLAARTITLDNTGRYRYCTECKVWKPDRCHHCSACNKCYLKRDHHCVWFPGCIGYNNHKFFVQFLLYSSVYAFWIFAATTWDLVVWFRAQRYDSEFLDVNVVCVWALSAAAVVALTAFCAFNVYLVTKNQTTGEFQRRSSLYSDLEMYADCTNEPRPVIENPFDLGSRRRNWAAVMGDSWKEWLLPMRTSAFANARHSFDESGLYFTIDEQAHTKLLESMELQAQLIKRFNFKRVTHV
ncbi:AaceriADL197Cp [[Ashbya] aceris (nom. inval.)]|nr:AaceriADL197Cp [[Ashbya] aceris (nom. inval.)]